MDEDLASLTRDELITEVQKLRQGIRAHRDSTMHELCWHHPELWGLLPEKIEPEISVPEWPQFLRGCVRYRESLDQQIPNAPRIVEEFEESRERQPKETRKMSIKRLDHVSVVVDDLAAGMAFFAALGMTREGETQVEGPWLDSVNGLENVQADIVMMRTLDGNGRLELTKFRNPKLVEIKPAIAPPNTLGLRSVMFTVESVDDTVARLRASGAELIGKVAQYEDKYRLCYIRGPAGIIVALAEELF